MPTLIKFECILRGTDGSRWSMEFQAEDFAHAEEQCKDALPDTDDSELIQIVKD